MGAGVVTTGRLAGLGYSSRRAVARSTRKREGLSTRKVPNWPNDSAVPPKRRAASTASGAGSPTATRSRS